jgi:hypothetical protein
MSWIAAFFSNWYSILYAVGAIICIVLILWIWKGNLARFRISSNRVGARFAKFAIMILLFSFSVALGIGAYQVTDFVRYFAVKKMQP